ncbi:uncharacterized protein LOC142952517 [Anarhichas minor]|uniref:uncharacterized protein LOC142952517 n=1 Tax=Anarhichas minor TaxID=65739 RepID=UPI003F73B4CC
MKGTAKSKVVTSGRLTGVKGQRSRRRGTPDPGPAACPGPAYSLYSTSTDSEEQVSSLHKGLDRCAALLTDILQAEKAGLPTAVKGGAAKSTPCSSLWKKTIRNTKTEQRGWQPGPGSTTRRPAVKTSTYPPVKQTSTHPPEKRTSIHPPEKRTSTHPLEKQTSTHPPEKQTSTHPPEKQTSIHPPEKQTSIHPPEKQTSIHPPEKQTSIHPPEKQTSIHPPEKQTSTHPPQTSIHPLEKQTSTHPPEKQTSTHPPQNSIHPLEKQTSTHPPQTSSFPGRPQTSISISYCEAECDREEEEFAPVRDIDVQSSAVRPTWTMKMSNMQLELGQVDKVPQDGSAETDRKVKTVQYLLGELKALIAGQGSVAERLLSHLEQTVSSPLMDAGSSNIRTEPQQPSHHMQNTQLRRPVRTLNQQLKQRGTAESHQNLEMLCNLEVWTLQEELGTAQSRLQDLQEDLAGLRNALEDTQSRLTDREAENALLQTDLEATRSRLLDSERERSEMASLAQQRLEDIGNLNRILQCEQHCNQHQHRPDPAEPPTDRISQFLMSLGQPVCVSAEREGKTLRDTSSHPAVGPQRGDKDPSHGSDGVQSCVEERSRLSRCHVESLCSDWSTRSGSSFDTRDEVAFRDGLAALDASIASLQKTMRLDLGS